MNKSKIKRIWALGTKDKAFGKCFKAKRDKQGRYVLNRKPSGGAKAPTTCAVNKFYASTLDEAAEMLATDDYQIRLTSDDGQTALRCAAKAQFERS